MAENRYCDIEAFLDTIPQYAGESGVVRAHCLKNWDIRKKH